MFELRFKESVKKDFRRIGRSAAARVMKAIREKLLPDPKAAGKVLKGQDGELWSFRAGDYRVLYVFDEKDVWVLVVRVGNRKDVYKTLPER